MVLAQEIQRQLDAGDLENIYVRDDAFGAGGDIPLTELEARQERDRQVEDGLEAEAEDCLDVTQGESDQSNEAMPFLGAEVQASNSSAAGGAGAAEKDAAPVAAGKDTCTAGHPGSPAAKSSEKGRQEDSSGKGARDKQESTGNPSAATAAQASQSSVATAPARESTSRLEGQQDRAAIARQAEKLAKQRELFGTSFSTPQRFVQIPPLPGM